MAQVSRRCMMAESSHYNMQFQHPDPIIWLERLAVELQGRSTGYKTDWEERASVH